MRRPSGLPCAVVETRYLAAIESHVCVHDTWRQGCAISWSRSNKMPYLAAKSHVVVATSYSPRRARSLLPEVPDSWKATAYLFGETQHSSPARRQVSSLSFSHTQILSTDRCLNGNLSDVNVIVAVAAVYCFTMDLIDCRFQHQFFADL